MTRTLAAKVTNWSSVSTKREAPSREYFVQPWNSEFGALVMFLNGGMRYHFLGGVRGTFADYIQKLTLPQVYFIYFFLNSTLMLIRQFGHKNCSDKPGKIMLTFRNLPGEVCKACNLKATPTHCTPVNVPLPF